MSRELKRSIARRMMEIHGVKRINKKNRIDYRKESKDNPKKVSFFSLHWKEYLDPESEYRKDLANKLKTMTARYNRANGTHFYPPWPVTKFGTDVARKQA